MASVLDQVDRALISALRAGRSSLTEIARRAGVARGTAYSRLDRLERIGAITGYGPDIDPAVAGLGVTAFCTLEISQGDHDMIIETLSAVREVLEIHTVTGMGDLLCRIVTRSNDHLHEVLQIITAIPGVTRAESQLALHTSHRRTVADLIANDDTDLMTGDRAR